MFRKNLQRITLVVVLLCMGVVSVSALTITKAQGWLEALCVEWSPVEGAASYQVTYSGEGATAVAIDDMLIREYPDYMRADVPGLKAGSYSVTVKAFADNGAEIDQATSSAISVRSLVREGFAFTDGYLPGGYRADGTVKDGAKIIYVTSDNINTVTCNVAVDKKGEKPYTGLTEILKARGKGYEETPMIIRVIGCIKKAAVAGLKSGNYIEFTGADRAFSKRLRNITIEGIGNDATLHGIGIFLKRSLGVEVRNLGFMLFGDDGVSMEANNAYNWVHHCDFFYGAPGGDADQKKGDGSIDMKYETTHITIDNNHFWDSGKCSFAGGTGSDETTDPIYFTYHHNWFDHCDSRLPRVCRATVHVYNNYYDGNPTMCILSVERASVFVEANDFRNSPWPLEMNMQGSNKERWPSGEQSGGFIKAYNNSFEGSYTLYSQNDRPTDYDAYVVGNREDKVPETEVTQYGGTKYSNFDTAADMYSYTAEAPSEVRASVKADAGRMEGGDLQWTFNNSTDDASSAIIDALKAAITNYESKLVSVGTSAGGDPMTTGVISIDYSPLSQVSSMANSVTDVWYTLHGCRLSGKPVQRGIYIVNGKRVVIR